MHMCVHGGMSVCGVCVRLGYLCAVWCMYVYVWYVYVLCVCESKCKTTSTGREWGGHDGSSVTLLYQAPVT